MQTDNDVLYIGKEGVFDGNGRLVREYTCKTNRTQKGEKELLESIKGASSLTKNAVGFEMQMNELHALERLITTAKGFTGQSKKAAKFLLSWWNAEEWGGFDLREAWGCDSSIAEDMIIVFGLIVRLQKYPDTLGYESDFAQIVAGWPQLRKTGE